jgi:hypothetical protein
MTAPRHLKAVRQSRSEQALQYRCDLITQAVLGGDIDFRVQAMSPVVGPGPGRISIRLGRVVLVIEDRDALGVLASACRQAEGLADRTYGPELPIPVYKPRARKAR